MGEFAPVGEFASEEGNNLAYIEKHRGKWSEETQSYLTSISNIDE